MTDSIRYLLANAIRNYAETGRFAYDSLADAIIADPDLLVLRREDVTQVGWHWLPEGSGCWAPVFLVNGYEP